MDRASPFSPLATPDLGAPRNRAHLAQTLAWVEAVFRTLRQRRQLMMLDERALHDIGLSRADAEGEWSRPFWDLPQGP